MSQYLKLLLDFPVVIAAIFIAGIGGTFQYGFSVSVLTSPSVFIMELVNKTCVQRYGVSLESWQVSLIFSFTVSIFCIGGLVGSLGASPLVSKYGRKRCLLLNNVIAMLGALLMLLSQKALSFEMIMAGRIFYGINSGVSLCAHTIYLVECAPKRLRGMVGVTVATFISFGKFCGQLLGIRSKKGIGTQIFYLLAVLICPGELLGTAERWPWLLGFNGVTALLQVVTLPFLPESPSFLLLNRGDRQACEKALRRLWGDKDYTREVEEMMKENASMQNVHSRSLMELFRDKSVRWQLITIIITFIGLQLCGINAVYFYSFDVFRAAGIQEQHLRYAALGTGLCEVIASLTCFLIIESMGKKVLLFRGYMIVSLMLVLLTITLSLQAHVYWMPYCSMVLVFLFIVSFSCGPAGVIAPLPGEILNQSYKSAGYTLACTLNWTSLFLLGIVFPFIVRYLGSFCFLIFLFFCMFSGLYVRFNVPETKNKTTLEIAAEFEKIHSKKSPDPNLSVARICESKL